MTRPLRALPARSELMLEALAAALDGSGPALLPLPPEPSRVLAEMRPDEPLEHDDIAVVVPTSGSTGQAKGVLLTSAALTASAVATAAHLGGQGQWLLAIPATHVGGLQVLVRSLLAGTDPAIMPAGPFTPAGFVQASALLRPTAATSRWCPPSCAVWCTTAGPRRSMRCARSTPCCSGERPLPARC